MPFDCFLEIDAIPGESTDEKHKNWIEIYSFSFGASMSISGARSDAGAASSGRVDLQDFSIMKALDKASPKLFECICKGTHIKKVVLELCNAAGNKTEFMEYKMEDVLVTSYQPSGSQGGSSPTESVTFNPGIITLTYVLLDHDTGAKKGNVTSKWDQTANAS